MKEEKVLNKKKRDILKKGTVIPAHPLALNEKRELDEVHQQALTRYYTTAGAGGLAVGVHTTQFEIRDYGLLEPVLELVSTTLKEQNKDNSIIKIAGICGDLDQSIQEAELAREKGYDLGLLSMGNLDHLTEKQLIARTRKIGEIIPVFGFYLQPAVGGRYLSYEFWKEFCEIKKVKAIKVAPFDRYETLKVVKAVCFSSRTDEIALYTGNDDNIVNDLVTSYRFKVKGEYIEKDFAGGLLGQWAVWTKKSVELLEKIKEIKKNNKQISREILILGGEITEANSAIFDSENKFQGCIPGIHEILRRQGLLKGRWCLDPEEKLSPGQLTKIDEIYESYPHLNDDEFVKENLGKWKPQ
ncbi:MAG: dihydrodipicolinate synthase family protein [bacterium]